MRNQPQEGPWADTLHGGPWTRHGHSIPGKTVLGENRPRKVYRCGGVRLCRICQADAEAAAFPAPPVTGTEAGRDA